jgi:xylan 1,4-beta-xylosidase
MKTIHNPVLRGFNPDPSFLRVGDDYYLATSTFEWFPGVQLHHSRDLVRWKLIGHALTEKRLLDLKGIPNSGGVWAPSLSWNNGEFFLIYTCVRTCGMGRPYKDTPFYVITARDILGPWSDPVHLGSGGFDPSLFHDDDGRRWLVNMAWDFRKDKPRFAGITAQEYDHGARRLVGSVRTILQKKELVEGPNLYQHGGFYYLMLAEGGTGWNHGISMARARAVTGPYELDPQGSVLTSRDDEQIELQKSGHGEIVQLPSGDWYLAHLCSRPIGEGKDRRCILGRETAIQQVTWSEDGWLRLASGGTRPQVEVPAPVDLPWTPWPAPPEKDDFDRPALDIRWSSLRIPVDATWLTLEERPGWLRLRGRESLFSLFEQSLVARRLESLRTVVETCLEFSPANFNQAAGLIFWYDTKSHYYLRVTHDEVRGKVLGIVLADDGARDEIAESEIAINGWTRCHLRAELDHARLQFSASPDGATWQPIGPVLDASKLSDDYGSDLRFTGAFVGLCAQDLNGSRMPADFDYFILKIRPSDQRPARAGQNLKT